MAKRPLEGKTTCSWEPPTEPFRISGHRCTWRHQWELQCLIHFTQAHLPTSTQLWQSISPLSNSILFLSSVEMKLSLLGCLGCEVTRVLDLPSVPGWNFCPHIYLYPVSGSLASTHSIAWSRRVGCFKLFWFKGFLFFFLFFILCCFKP